MRKIYRDGLPYIYEEDHLAALEAAECSNGELTIENDVLREKIAVLKADHLVEMKEKDDQVRHLHTTNDTVKGANYTLKVEQSQLQAIIETQAEQIAGLRAIIVGLREEKERVEIAANEMPQTTGKP